MLSTPAARLGQYLNTDGSDVLQVVAPGGATQYAVGQFGGVQVSAQLLSVDQTISGRVPGFFVITKGSIATITVSAPTAGADDGLEIEISSNTNFAHVVAVGAGKLLMGAAAAAQVTLPAFAGATVYLTAYQGKWIVCTGGNGTYTPA
jgi:hypothetical protein